MPLTEADRQRIKRDIKRHRHEAKIIRVASVPTRGEVDAYGEVFPGLPGSVLGLNEITAAELKTNGNEATERAIVAAAFNNDSLPARAFPMRNPTGGTGNVRALHTEVKVDSNNVVGELNVGNIPALGKDKVPNLNDLNGGLDGAKLHKKSVPSGAIHNMHGSKIVGKNSIDWKNVKVSGVVFTPRLNSEIDALKRWANNQFQRKP